MKSSGVASASSRCVRSAISCFSTSAETLGPERVARRTGGVVEVEQALERRGGAARGDLADQAAEVGAVGGDATADVDEVLRRGFAGELAHAALKADAGDVVLAAAVRAAGDLDVEAVRRGDEIGAAIEQVGEHAGEAARCGDRELAARRARAARDIGDRVRAGLREADARELAMQRGELRGRDEAQHEVLLVRQPDLAFAVLHGELGDRAQLRRR